MSPRGEIAIPMPGKVTGQGKLSRQAVRYGGLVCCPGNRRKRGCGARANNDLSWHKPAIGARGMPGCRLHRLVRKVVVAHKCRHHGRGLAACLAMCKPTEAVLRDLSDIPDRAICLIKASSGFVQLGSSEANPTSVRVQPARHPPALADGPTNQVDPNPPSRPSASERIKNTNNSNS
jgi:hypothetical protein